MKINPLNLAVYSFLFLTVTFGFFSLNENRKLNLENYKIKRNLSLVKSEILSYKSENKRLETKLKNLSKLESMQLSFLDAKKTRQSELSQQFIQENKNAQLLKELELAKQKILSLESGEKPDYKVVREERPKMSSRRKYFLTHGMYPEQHRQFQVCMKYQPGSQRIQV